MESKAKTVAKPKPQLITFKPVEAVCLGLAFAAMFIVAGMIIGQAVNSCKCQCQHQHDCHHDHEMLTKASESAGADMPMNSAAPDQPASQGYYPYDPYRPTPSYSESKMVMGKFVQRKSGFSFEGTFYSPENGERPWFDTDKADKPFKMEAPEDGSAPQDGPPADASPVSPTPAK